MAASKKLKASVKILKMTGVHYNSTPNHVEASLTGIMPRQDCPITPQNPAR
jgi:hypothetical protein